MRVALTDGQWFETDNAEEFEEGSWWNGNNHISKATGSQWDHQKLYKTKGENWVLNSWSQYQNVEETYEEISNEEAARWLVQNGYDCHEDCEEEYAALEIK